MLSKSPTDIGKVLSLRRAPCATNPLPPACRRREGWFEYGVLMDTSHWQPLADWGLTEADRMDILASQCRQLGFRAVAAHLSENAAKARAWANEEYRRGAERASCPIIYGIRGTPR